MTICGKIECIEDLPRQRMDPKSRSIIIGGVVLLILASVFGTVFYLGRVAKEKRGETPEADPLSQLEVTGNPNSQTDTGTGSGQQSNLKTFTGAGFNVPYPSSWGLLTCSNSANFEFDPTSSSDVRSVVCDVAVKPVTVLVTNRLSCQGETVKLGNHQVIRSKVSAQSGDANYRWCFSVGGKNLEVTHRISASGSRATSKEDFSAAVEQIITGISIGGS